MWYTLSVTIGIFRFLWSRITAVRSNWPQIEPKQEKIMIKGFFMDYFVDWLTEWPTYNPSPQPVRDFDHPKFARSVRFFQITRI